MRSALALALVTSVIALAGAACKKDPPPEASGTRTSSAESVDSKDEKGSKEIVTGAPAAIGQPAPDFALKDLDDKEVRLSQYKGKVVVLEWFNPGCPFVKRAHTKGSLKDSPQRHLKEGVVWIAVNSGAAGKEGHGASANRAAAKSFGMTYPILLDESGAVGKAYGATNTPHMYVVDAKGVLVYRGAIDNSPDGEGESAPDGKLVGYVDEALTAIAQGKSVSVAETKAYGCGVKYASH